MVRVLITCTQPRSDDIVADLKNSSVDAIAIPALNVLPKQTDKPEGNFGYLLISSRHALEIDLPDLPVIAVGENTATLAQNKGLYVTHTGDGGVQDINLTPYNNILYPCAHEPSFIPNDVTPWPVYESRSNTAFSIPDDVDFVCVFSVKAARIVRSHCLPHHHIMCLSQNIADIFEMHGFQNLAVCHEPRYDAMKQLILQRYTDP